MVYIHGVYIQAVMNTWSVKLNSDKFRALLSHVLTAYYLVTVVDSCFITRFLVFSSSILHGVQQLFS